MKLELDYMINCFLIAKAHLPAAAAAAAAAAAGVAVAAGRCTRYAVVA